MVTPIIILSSLPLLFATGFIWPQEMLPLPIRTVMALLPTAAGIQGVLRLNTMGADWSAVTPLWYQLWGQVVLYGLLLCWVRRRKLQNSEPVI